jgi:hypothetical protein
VQCWHHHFYLHGRKIQVGALRICIFRGLCHLGITDKKSVELTLHFEQFIHFIQFTVFCDRKLPPLIGSAGHHPLRPGPPYTRQELDVCCFQPSFHSHREQGRGFAATLFEAGALRLTCVCALSLSIHCGWAAAVL